MHGSSFTGALTIGTAMILTAFAPTRNTAPQVVDSMQVVIGSGEHAGTYDLAAANITCMKIESASRFSAVFKDVSVRSKKVIGEVGINVDAPGKAGPKGGEINITFGEPETEAGFTFDVNVPDAKKNSFSYSESGKSVTVGFDGSTRDGVKVRVKAHCDDPMAF